MTNRKANHKLCDMRHKFKKTICQEFFDPVQHKLEKEKNKKRNKIAF